jgi:hypothetical protein
MESDGEVQVGNQVAGNTAYEATGSDDKQVFKHGLKICCKCNSII